MLKKFIFSLTAIMALSLVAMAYDDKAMEGIIVDKNCATGKVAKQGGDLQTAAANETRGCILMTSCVNSGLGLYSDGKYYLFDAKGNELGKAALEKSKKDKGAKFKVTGKVTGDRIAVASIEEIVE
jgi:hypothetical protein